MTLIEVALDDVAGARLAEQAGAGRLELCNGLADNGGTTPSAGFVREVTASLRQIPAMTLIRARGGDFVYSREELAVMRRDIEILRACGSAGFVVGALTPDGEVDVAAVRDLVAAAGGAPVTFHRAFDSTRDLARSLDVLADLGVGRILSSGGRATALEGAPTLRSLAERAAERVVLVAGGRVRPGNVAEIVARSGVTEVHLRAAVPYASSSRYVNPSQPYDAAPVSVTDPTVVRQIGQALRGGRS
ncbi:MAG TPA: copper homeostasis protein CutC [Trebonia sp.]|nr:copper homeostasis protein CutC [Trebonia sp.]